MLMLSRRVRERIVIGDDIIVEVVRIHGGKVQLGITAPETVLVDREEIRLAKNGLAGRGGHQE